MTLTGIVEVISASVGLAVTLLVAAFPRFGTCSTYLAVFTGTASLGGAALALTSFLPAAREEQTLRVSFALFLIAAPGGLAFAASVARELPREALLRVKWVFALTGIVALILASWLILAGPLLDYEVEVPEEYVVLGIAGYLGALGLLGASILALAHLERTLRSAAEETRFQIKFLVLGAAALLGTFVFVGSRVLLYPPGNALVPRNSLHVVPFVSILAWPLILTSWLRAKSPARVEVSQRIIYSSVTFLAVGIYLIVSSTGARWAHELFGEGVDLEAALFICAALILGILLLSTRARGRLRHWLRRNVFSGRYDYRTAWLEATQRVLSTDPPETVAASVTAIIQRSLRTDRVTVWTLDGKRRALWLLSHQGGLDLEPGRTFPVAIDQLEEPVAPFSVEDPPLAPKAGLPLELLQSTKASLVAPLRSGGRVIGIITTGSDRSGVPYDAEAREFLGVLASHAAGEFHEGQLLQAMVAAKEAEAFRSFSTFLLHDLKNFASTLSLIATNAARHGNDPGFQKDAFESIHHTSEKMKRLCNSLRAFSGSLAAHRAPTDLCQLARDVVKSLEKSFSDHIHLDVAPVPMAFLDREEVSRVLQNLLLNARDAISEQGAITVRTSGCSEGVEVVLSDDGKGIPKEFLAKDLFQPFRTTKSEGLGIGLFHSKRIVEAHGGKIEVFSEEGKGTTVRVVLPLGGGEVGQGPGSPGS